MKISQSKEITRQIPSIGTPLPDTNVTVEPDGELIVSGPQVCLGYYGMNVDTIKDGVLRSGDLGSCEKNREKFALCS